VARLACDKPIVLEHPHDGVDVLGMIRKHTHTADVRRPVKTFQDLLEIAC